MRGWCFCAGAERYWCGGVLAGVGDGVYRVWEVCSDVGLLTGFAGFQVLG